MISRLRRLAPRSLTGRLVATVVILVALVSVLGAVLTMTAMRSYLTARLDTEVVQTLKRAMSAPPNDSSTRGDSGDHGDPVGPFGQGPDVSIPIGQRSGTLTAEVDESGIRGDVVTETSERRPMSTAALKAVAAVPADGQVHAVELPGLGTYRLMAGRTEQGTVVTGLS